MAEDGTQHREGDGRDHREQRKQNRPGKGGVGGSKTTEASPERRKGPEPHGRQPQAPDL